jgi:hypothetical protein
MPDEMYIVGETDCKIRNHNERVQLMKAFLLMALLVGYEDSPGTQMSPTTSPKSAVFQAADWTSSGVYGDFGAPNPTWECHAAASGGDLICSGITMAKSGTATTVSTPYYPAGFSGTSASASNTETVTPATWRATDDDPALSTFTITGIGMVTSASTGTGSIWSRFAPSWRGYMDVYLGRLYLGVGRSDYDSFKVRYVVRPITTDVWNIFCGSYSGGATMHLNVSSDAASAVGVGAAISGGANETFIGGAWTGYQPWNGKLTQISFYKGWAATAAQCANVVNDWQNRRSRIPNDTLTFTRATTETCTPVSGGSSYTIPVNTPCVTENGLHVTTGTTVTSKVTPITANKRGWCAQIEASLTDWASTGVSQGLLALGDLGVANTAVLLNSSGILLFVTRDAASDFKSVSWTHGFVNGSNHKIKACYNALGTHYFVIDGVRQAGTSSGTGTSPSTLPTTLHIGSIVGLVPMDGHVKHTRICRTEGGCGL